MQYLKQSTASQADKLGPFVDTTDANTAETALSIANTDIRISKAGGDYAAKNSGGGTHDEGGWYTVTYDATDTDTVGRMKVYCHVTGALPVWSDYHVLEEDIYDALIAPSAAAFDSNQRVDVGAVGGTSQTAGDVYGIASSISSTTSTVLTRIGSVSFGNDLFDAIGDLSGSIPGLHNPATDGLQVLRQRLDLIEADTQDLQTQVGTAGAGLTAVAWNAAWDAEVESEVIDALDTAISELGVGAPSATPGLRDAVMLLYMALRNETVVQTSGTDALEIYNDAGTKIASKLLTDDGSDYTEDEMA